MPQTSKADLQFLEQFEPDVFWQKHGQKITWGVVAVIAIGLVVVYSQRQSAERQELAAEHLSEARDAATLQRLAQDFKGSELGAQAELRLADAQYQTGHLEESAASYHDFVTTYPQNPLLDTALLGQATALESLGKFDDAKRIYQQILSHPGSYASVSAKMGLARCAEAAGQNKEAAQYYEELLPAVANTPWESQVVIRLSVLARNLEPEHAGQPASPAITPSAPLTIPQLTPAPAK